MANYGLFCSILTVFRAIWGIIALICSVFIKTFVNACETFYFVLKCFQIYFYLFQSFISLLCGLISPFTAAQGSLVAVV